VSFDGIGRVGIDTGVWEVGFGHGNVGMAFTCPYQYDISREIIQRTTSLSSLKSVVECVIHRVAELASKLAGHFWSPTVTHGG
jgi:hypothetical protein